MRRRVVILALLLAAPGAGVATGQSTPEPAPKPARESAPKSAPESAPRPSRADPTPMIPVGLDAYRMWDRWAYQRIGARAYMRSTYDRSGGNRTADASHFLYQEAEDFNVTLDVEGKGVLYFVRTNHWHGSPWHYEVDGVGHIVEETTTADPTRKLEHSVFMPEHLFPNPLTWTYSITKGADLMWVPIAFEERFRLAYSRTFYGTGYYIYHHYADGANLSRPIRAWDGNTPPDPDVLDLLRAAGTDIAPEPDTREGRELGVRERSGSLDLPVGESVLVAAIDDAPAMVRALELSAPRDRAVTFGRARLRIAWDGREAPSIDAPIALFFGAGTLHDRDGKEFLVKALPVNVRFDGDRVRLACYFPMPFFQSARIELVGPADPAGRQASDAGEAEGRTPIAGIEWSVRTQAYRDPPNHVGYLHATYRDHGLPTPGVDNVFLDTREVEGGGDWSGSFVGTSFTFSDRAVLTTLEGDPRFFFDDSQTPQAYGTGTEEWGGGGDYWGGLNMSLPLAGHPVGVRRPEDAKDPEELIQSAYRFLLADLMPFGKRAVIRLEHGGENESVERYRSVAYWYGLPAPSLVLTDELDVGDPASEREHRYVSPDASAPYELTSRYEWGVEPTAPGAGSAEPIQVTPAHTERGRTTTTYSEFTLRLRADNVGAILRRTLDYKYPNQRAEVHVADAESEAEGKGTRADSESRPPEWRRAGVWYLAGSSTFYHSYPQDGELGRSRPVVLTSNRRFRDDEFLVPRALTEGRSAIRVRVTFTPVEIPLLPGRPLDELAWSEIRYRAYSWVMPDFERR